MEKLQISTIDNVILSRRGYCITGKLILSTYHLVFSFVPASANPSEQVPPKEIWICYPIIDKIVKSRGSSLVSSRTNPFTVANGEDFRDSQLANSYKSTTIDHYSASNIRIQCKDFTFYSFDFINDLVCNEVYYKLSALITAPKVSKDIKSFYAFNYKPNSMETDLQVKGWEIYDPVAEYKRQGLGGDDTAAEGPNFWRITDINNQYKLCNSYPRVLVVPESISDNVIKHASKFRSKQRIPATVYRHRLNPNANVIARCAQPLVGIKIQNRSIQDEKLIGEIFETQKREREFTLSEDDEFVDQPQKNLIVDLRPITNAMAQHALGAGTENIDNYRGRSSGNGDNSESSEAARTVDKIFGNIDNIHVIRDSLNKLTNVLNDLDRFPVSMNADDPQISYAAFQQALSKTQWLHRLSIILQSVDRITKSVHLNNTNVLIHCSDGWDRTSQVSALSQLCLDPYYRTLKGFMVLVEKEWVSFGFKFNTRADHGGCTGAVLPKSLQDSDFEDATENNGSARSVASFLQKAAGRAAVRIRNTASAAAAAAAAELASNNGAGGSAASSTTDLNDSSSSNGESESSSGFFSSHTYGESSEKSPVFHQFLDCVYQIFKQHPTHFEFNSRFLKRLFYHYYSCQYGSFLCDSERELSMGIFQEGTVSVWDYFNSRPKEFINPAYVSQEEVIFFNYSDVKWWTELYGRSDEEMNGLSNSLDRKFAKMKFGKT